MSGPSLQHSFTELIDCPLDSNPKGGDACAVKRADDSSVDWDHPMKSDLFIEGLVEGFLVVFVLGGLVVPSL